MLQNRPVKIFQAFQGLSAEIYDSVQLSHIQLRRLRVRRRRIHHRAQFGLTAPSHDGVKENGKNDVRNGTRSHNRKALINGLAVKGAVGFSGIDFLVFFALIEH